VHLDGGRHSDQAIHVRGPRTRYARWPARNRLYHHFGKPNRNHGVTSPLWDLVFGTHDRVERVVLHARDVAAIPWLGQAFEHRSSVRRSFGTTSFAGPDGPSPESTLAEPPAGSRSRAISRPCERCASARAIPRASAVLLVCTLDRPDPKLVPLLLTAATARDLGGAGRIGRAVSRPSPPGPSLRAGRRDTSVYVARLLSSALDWV
jgi:hypothetical protein